VLADPCSQAAQGTYDRDATFPTENTGMHQRRCRHRIRRRMAARADYQTTRLPQRDWPLSGATELTGTCMLLNALVGAAGRLISTMDSPTRDETENRRAVHYKRI